MSPAGYVVMIPASLITLSVWWVRHEDSSFNDTQRTCAIQVQKKAPPLSGTPVTVDQIDPTLKLGHERYGAFNTNGNGGSNLGRDVVFRPMGERGESSTDWLVAQESRRSGGPMAGKPGKIADYQETPPPADPLEEAIPTTSGYDIVADEVTKIEIGKNRVVFSGHVRMASPQFYLTSDQLVIFLGKDKSSMNSAEASGNVNVRLTSVPPERVCRTQSGKALFDPSKDTLTLLDWPKIKSQSQEQIAAADTKMIIVTKTGKMTTQGKALTRVAKSFMAETTSAPPANPSTPPTVSAASTSKKAPPLAPLPQR